MAMLDSPLLADASQVPFSEKARLWRGLGVSKSVSLLPDLTSKILIFPSLPPAARRWPSGWKAVAPSAAVPLVKAADSV